METFLHIVLNIVSILLIAIFLLQGGKTEGASNIISGGNDSLFANRKERGGELFITRLTMILGIIFIVICTVL
ncbi:MAG: preprotein translocase subunit SecG [Bacilli bacterium]|nr:preprotein translocase subunit SecG [Bacilli bacterium]MDD4733907.1 preprotein translocase subunit SecG [Bacilli bacterium]